MRFKKVKSEQRQKGYISEKEKKSIAEEIKRQLAEYDRKHAIEMDALILWILHTKFNFGPKRLREFYDSFANEIKELVDRYELEDSDDIWLCTFKLKDKGIDLEAWHRETEVKR